MQGHGGVAFVRPFELRHHVATKVRHRGRSIPFLIATPFLAGLLLVAFVMAVALAAVALAVYLVALIGAVGWGLLGPCPAHLTLRESVARAVGALNAHITGSRRQPPDSPPESA